MRAFESRGAHAVAHLDSHERAIFARLVADVGELISGEAFMQADTADQASPSDDPLEHVLAHFTSAPQTPSDPALLRLFPHAAPHDAEVSEEFRRFTEHELKAIKIDRLRAIWIALTSDDDEWAVAETDVMSTAAALTDVRLVLASRLGIVTDEDANALHRDVEAAQVALEADDADLGETPERIWMGLLYQALTWLQESLLDYAMRNDV